MAKERESARFQVTMRKETGEKISELAERMRVSESKMIEMLIEAAIEDNEWVIKAVTSKWARTLAEVLTGKKARSKAHPKGA